MKKSILLFLTLFLLIPALAPACPSYYETDQAYLKIEFAPVFAYSNGSGQTTGSYFTVYNESFSIGPPSSGRMDTNTGIYIPPLYAERAGFLLRRPHLLYKDSNRCVR